MLLHRYIVYTLMHVYFSPELYINLIVCCSYFTKTVKSCPTYTVVCLRVYYGVVYCCPHCTVVLNAVHFIPVDDNKVDLM